VKSTEQDVPDRQIGVVAVVNAALVVNAVALRPLHKVAKPTGRAHIPVVEQLHDAADRDRDSRRLGREAEHEEQERSPENRVGGDLERVLVEARCHLDPRGAVMDLVEQAPQQRDFMTGAMPPVIRECNGEVANGCAAEDAELPCTVDQAVLLQPGIEGMTG
jgi:hypothetical protein